METEQTRALVQEFNDAWINRDAEALALLMSEDVAWDMPVGLRPPGLGEIVGIPAIIAAFIGGPDTPSATLWKLDTIERTVHKLVVDGDTAVGYHTMKAELVVGGGTYENEYVWRYTCADGKVVRLEESADTINAYKQMKEHPMFDWVFDS